MSGVIALCPMYALKAWAGKTLPLIIISLSLFFFFFFFLIIIGKVNHSDCIVSKAHTVFDF